MNQPRNALRAGIFILASIAVIVAIVIGIAGLEHFTTSWRTHKVRFKLSDDVGGLFEGDEVRLGGHKVGVVRDIRVTDLSAVDRGEEPGIVIEFTMPEKYVVRANAQIAIQETITGTSWLNISNLGSGAPLSGDDALAGGPSTTTRLLRSLEGIAPQTQGLITDLRTQTVPRVNTTIDKYATVADRAAETMTHTRDILGEGKTDIRGTISNLNSATATVKEKLPALLDKLDGSLTSAKTAIDKTIGVLAELEPTMVNARQISDSARSLVAGNRGKIDDMVSSLKTTGENLKSATAEIRRSPWRLLYKPRPNEMANLNLYDAARQFAEGANDLNDAAMSLRDALATHDLTEEQLQTLLSDLDGSFESFNQVEEALWEKVKE